MTRSEWRKKTDVTAAPEKPEFSMDVNTSQANEGTRFCASKTSGSSSLRLITVTNATHFRTPALRWGIEFLRYDSHGLAGYARRSDTVIADKFL